MTEDERDRFEAVAREQWDDQWTIEAQYFADGSDRLHAYSNRGRTSDGERIQERLIPGEDDELHLVRALMTGGEKLVEREVIESSITVDE